MHSILLFAAVSVCSPAPKDPPPLDCRVVHAVCTTTTDLSGPERESSFVVTEPGKELDIVKGKKFTVRYWEAGVAYVSSAGTRLFLAGGDKGDAARFSGGRKGDILLFLREEKRDILLIPVSSFASKK